MRKERYDQLIQESALVWHKLYEEEREAREELQRKYDLLTKQIKEQGIEKANENAKERLEEDFWDNLEQAAKEAGEAWDEPKASDACWDEERIDIIGTNGNDGLHYVDYGAGKRPVQHIMKQGEFGELRDGFKEP